MIELVEIASELQSFLEAKDQPFCFIGGLALLRWGEQRATKDVDLTVLTRFENEAEIVASLLSKYEARVDDALKFALRNRVVLLRNSSGIGIDIGLGGFDYEV